MAVLIRALPLLLIGALPACERAPVAIEFHTNHVAVHALLQADADTVSLLLTRSQNEDGFARLPGARVLLHTGAETVELADAPAGMVDCLHSAALESPPRMAEPGCYGVVLPRRVQEGRRYGLVVRMPGGDSIVGSVVVPAAPRLVEPAGGARFEIPNGGEPRLRDGTGFGFPDPLAEVPVEWAGAPAGSGIQVRFAIREAFQGDRPLPPHACRADFREIPLNATALAGISRQVVSLNQFRCQEDRRPVAWDSASVRVLVTAYDTAYTRYARDVFEREVVRPEYAAAGLRGALGVFGGAATAEAVIRLAAVRPAAP